MSKQRQMISTCLQKRWATGPPLLSFCWYTDEIGDCLGSVWGQQVGVKVRSGGLWGQSRQKAASWETIPAFFKKEHPAPYNTHSGWSKPGAQREVLVWEDLRARKKQWSNLHHLSISQLKKIDSRLYWACKSREVNAYGRNGGRWNASLGREIVPK